MLFPLLGAFNVTLDSPGLLVPPRGSGHHQDVLALRPHLSQERAYDCIQLPACQQLWGVISFAALAGIALFHLLPQRQKPCVSPEVAVMSLQLGLRDAGPEHVALGPPPGRKADLLSQAPGVWVGPCFCCRLELCVRACVCCGGGERGLLSRKGDVKGSLQPQPQRTLPISNSGERVPS